MRAARAVTVEAEGRRPVVAFEDVQPAPLRQHPAAGRGDALLGRAVERKGRVREQDDEAATRELRPLTDEDVLGGRRAPVRDHDSWPVRLAEDIRVRVAPRAVVETDLGQGHPIAFVAQDNGHAQV